MYDRTQLAPEADAEHGSYTRRVFLRRAILGIVGFISGIIAVPAVAHTISPALTEPEENWVEVGSAAGFHSNEPKKVEYVIYKKDGWNEEPTARSCWVIKKSEQEFVVFDPRCTHLGCPYAWHSEKNQFMCPCHGGVFDIEGTVLAGPPPRPLRRFANKVDGGKLLVREEVINA